MSNGLKELFHEGWPACSGEFLAEVTGAHDFEVKSIEWAPVPVKTADGMRELLATAANDKKLKLWKSPIAY